MLHTCVKRFDVTGTVEFFLETKQGLNRLPLHFFLRELRLIHWGSLNHAIKRKEFGVQPSRGITQDGGGENIDRPL